MDSMRTSNNNEKKSKGRQKIEIKRVEKESSRYVTFSKRKAGIFKKASQLSTLSGAHVGVAIFSEHGKLFSSGYPYPQHVFDRFLSGREQLHDSVDEHNPFLSSSSSYINNEKEEHDHNDYEGQVLIEHWWDRIGDEDINNMSLEECLAYRNALLGLKIDVLQKLDAIAVTKYQAESSFNQCIL